MASMVSVERVGNISCTVGESPLWCAAQGAWLWVDIPAKTIWRLDATTGALRHWYTSEMVACIALQKDGSLIAGMQSGIFNLRLTDAKMALEQPLATPDQLTAGMRFNDGRCDRQGRFWSGTMFMDMAAARPDGHLYRYTKEQGISQPVVSKLIVQNGLGFSPDGRTMYLSDSHVSRQLIWAFDYDTDSGTPTNQRVFVDMHAHPGRPDGAAVDSDGCYWICGNDGGCILRFTPEGKLDSRINLPMAKPSMCSFGGDNLDTLLVTSIAAGKADGDLWAGAIVMLRAGVTGVAESAFSG